MKIFIFSNSFWNLYNFRLPLINKLKKKNIITLVASNDKFVEKFKTKNILIKKINFTSKDKSLFKNLFLFIKIFFFLKKEKPDLLLAFTMKPNIFAGISCRFLNINIINNITGLGTLFLQKNFFFYFIKYILRFSFKNSKIVFFHNSHEKKIFLNSNIINKYQTKITNGSGIKIKKKKKLFNKNQIKFIFSGRMIRDKGIFELIEAIKIVKSKYKNVSFSFYGILDNDNYGSISNYLIDYWDQTKLINFFPNVKNVINSLNKFDCFILPSYSEGLPKSLLEAASVGLPILCSDIPGCKGLVKNNYNGFLFKPKNIVSLSNAIEKFIKLSIKKRLLFGKNSRYVINKFYNEDIVVNNYYNEIKKYVK